jgi:hypothetical protein
MMPGVQQQDDVGTEPDLGVGRPTVVGEEILAFRRGEMDTGQRTRTAGRIRDRTPQQEVTHAR